LEETLTIEHQLIRKCKQGNKKAQRMLFEQYAKAMYHVALRIMGNEYEAEDVLQEAFVKIFDKLHSFKGQSSLGAWIKRIVVNQSISELRKRKMVFETMDKMEREIIEEDGFDIEEDVPIQRVMEAIEMLPEKSKLVFKLKAIEQLKFLEIAKILNASENNCKVLYHRAKKLLKEQLGPVVVNT
jgi:RNA polymerase sigma-70 factor (ECF subfamily)